MNYELAKELKEAGFPFIRIEGGMGVGRQGYFDFNPEGDEKIGAQHFYTPTLSELIEACGVDFDSLHHNSDGKWQALAEVLVGEPKTTIEDEEVAEGLGSTPEEAVARLWLSLIKK